MSQNNFSHNCWDSEKIKLDFKKETNMNLIWEICKYYLMQEGFRNRTKNLSKPKEYLTEVKTLGEL